MRYVPFFLAAALLLASLSAVARPARAAAEPPPELLVTTEPDGVRLEWRGGSASVQGTAHAPDLPRIEFGGFQLPAQTVALHLPDSGPAVPKLQRLEDVPWHGTLDAAAVPIPQTAEGEQFPALVAAPAQTLPAAPVVLLREGRLRGERVAVLALSPIFARDGQPRLATRVEASIPGATLLADYADTAATLLASLEAEPAPFLTNAPGPVTTLPQRVVWKIDVTDAGIQRISGATLAAAGIQIDALDPALLRVWHNGSAVPLALHGADDGRLDPADELRFFAPEPTDRWNTSATYWLSSESTPGPQMATRPAFASGSPLRPTARQQGTWRNNTLYVSTLPGPDGDHWFAADLRSGPEQPAATLDITLTHGLPLAAGSGVFTVRGTAFTTGPHRLALQVGATTQQQTWAGSGDWEQVYTVTTALQPDLRLSLLPGETASGVKLDSVAWDLPATLDVGGQGAWITTEEDARSYQLANVAPGSSLYDVRDPAAPVWLMLGAGSAPAFTDGAGPGRYVLAGEGTLHTPVVRVHTPANLATPLNAEVIYIAPAAFHEALAPLVALRESQGYRVAVVDVQQIYDAWNYGHVSPDAIRDFLRYAAATWNPAPLAVTLVGDGTLDPHNYLDKLDTAFIPPYLAEVDQYVLETACEQCYAQLDGDDPLDDPLPDLLLGRLPVKSADELAALVQKLIGYETASGGLAWRSRAVYLADNAFDSTGEPDRAGNFIRDAEASIRLQPAGISIARMYYDPSPLYEGVGWHVSDAAQAHQTALDLFSRGAGTLMYIGHSDYWQWATTDFAAEKPFLIGLNEVDTLTNADRLPVVLAMTCLSSSFHIPALRGTTIDERLVLFPDGGAVAVWGSAGLGVSHGHDALQRGFYLALWDEQAPSTMLGRLTLAGYTELFTRGGTCCQDTLRTFLLLGDPLTELRVQPANRVYLPHLQR